MIATAVIGAAFGDEGKGALVDALAATMIQPLVVRHNGGAQAGHSVQLPDGRRHVFSHIGAGTFAGAPTYLSRFFALNPWQFRCEREELLTMGVDPVVYVDPEALLVLPSDVLLCRWAEEARVARGDQRHGSVGQGYGESIARAEAGYGLKLRDVDKLIAHMYRVEREYLPARARQLGITYDLANGISALDINHEVDQVTYLQDHIRHTPLSQLADRHDLIFEGAQGLMLDATLAPPWFPHVTRSRTGVTNAAILAQELGLDFEVIYCTRAYLTRHGAGPLPGEVAELPGGPVVDPTNTDKPWQGSLRLAPLNIDLLRAAIGRDLAESVKHARRVSLAVSCLDQHLGGYGAIENQLSKLGLAIRRRTWGPTRDDGEFVARRKIIIEGSLV